MTQKQFGELIGVSYSMVSHYENEESPISARQLFDLCSKIGISSDYILGLDVNPTISTDGLSEQQIQLLQAIVVTMRKQNKNEAKRIDDE